MELSRRSFLRGVLAVAGATVAPALPAIASVPRIVGDGVHDDTAGLQAAFDGKPFVADGMVISDADWLTVHKGAFKVTRPITIRRSGVEISECSFISSDLAPDECLLNIEGTADCFVREVSIVTNYAGGVPFGEFGALDPQEMMPHERL